MPASTIQESGTAGQVAVQGHRHSPRDPRAKAGGAHRPTRARATGVLPWPAEIAPSGEPVRTDENLARAINTEHDHVETYKRNTIQHAIRCGELLLEMKGRVGHGNWLTWVQEHFEAGERTARNYMEIAKSAAVADLDDNPTHSLTSVRGIFGVASSQPTGNPHAPGAERPCSATQHSPTT